MDSQRLIRLDQEDIQSILPHQPPFVHINEVFDLVPGKSAKALKYIDPKDPIFTCHFPGNPIYPGIFLIEAAAQLAFVTFCYKQDSKVTTYSRAGYLGTGAAICNAVSSGSTGNLKMFVGRIPVLPVSKFCQNFFHPVPRGVIIPIPLMHTFLFFMKKPVFLHLL